MGFFARLRTGWALAMDSLDVLRAHPDLGVFPLVGGVAGFIYLALLITGSAVLGLDGGPALWVVLFILYFGSSFIAALFTAGLVYSVQKTFEGEEPSLRSGLAGAWEKRDLLFVWALASAVIGVLLRALERQRGLPAQIAASLFGVAWGILTYFIIPVILFEDVDARSMFRRSGETFKQTWGETAGAGFGVGIVTALFVIIGLAFAVLGFVVFAGSAVGVMGSLLFAALVLFAAVIFGQTLGAIARTALYVYATEGIQPSEFDDVDFSDTVS